MEEKINIADILKDKPQGTKLYDWLHNIDVELDTISTTETETVVWCTNETDNNTTCHRGYSEFGTVRGCFDGLQILLPSKEMRDWRKFGWQKGDVLVSKDNVYIIFEKFEDDTYTRFKGKHYLWKECDEEDYNKEETKILTSAFEKATDDVAQTYIKTIEERLGGKLNLETLEIEKSEFKDGDIVMSDSGTIVLVRGISLTRKIYYHAYMRNEYIYINQVEGEFFSRISRIKRFATDSEKQQLFDALAKEGKRWDSEKKQIVDLKPKVELKPFDRVLVRNCKSENWRANLFGYIDKDGFCCCVWANWAYCIPYIGNEHLLGTTKDVEG
jgi:hypothetical protein